VTTARVVEQGTYEVDYRIAYREVRGVRRYHWEPIRSRLYHRDGRVDRHSFETGWDKFFGGERVSEED
jgi:hypothetical protein